MFIISGVIAFVPMYLFDLFTLKNQKLIKSILGLLGIGLIIGSTYAVFMSSDVISIPFTIRIISSIFCGLFTLLLVYSLFIELPFTKTYGEELHHDVVVNTGTYALCRHPGVIWFGFAYFFLFLATGKILILYAAIAWTFSDIIYVFLQELTLFPKMFPRYCDYQKSTPMLIPNMISIKKCQKTFLHRGGQRET